LKTQLTEDEIKGLLARAEEIHLGTSAGEDSDAVILAAQEAGLPREVVEQALREQFELFPEPPAPGDLVYAKSTDDHLYVAEVTANTDSGIQVRFLKGGESTVHLQHLRPTSFLPGEQLTVHWPWWGWWDVTVLNYDAESSRVRVDDGWGDEMWFPLSDVRLGPPKAKNKRKAIAWRYATLIAASGTVGAVIMWLVMR